MSDAWLGFLGGIAASLVAAVAASFVQRHNQEKARKVAGRFEIYMRLLDINQQYFWVASAELHGQKPPPDIVRNVRNSCWQLADKLREYDAVELQNEIMEFLFSTAIPSSNERAGLLGSILDRYGKIVNPKYSEQIRQLSNDNVMRTASGDIKSYPPTTLWPDNET